MARARSQSLLAEGFCGVAVGRPKVVVVMDADLGLRG
jgi:hypothetical protein